MARFRPSFIPLEPRLVPANYGVDSTFNNFAGLERTHFLGGDDYATAVTVDFDGLTVVAGTVTSGDHTTVGLIRLNPDGTRDTSFGRPGTGRAVIEIAQISPTAKSARAFDLVPFSYTVGGRPATGYFVAGAVRIGADEDMLLLALDNAGNLFTGFDRDGVWRTDSGGADDVAYEVATTAAPGGTFRVLVAGTWGRGRTGSDFAVIALDGNGAADTAFGSAGGGGRVTADFGPFDDLRGMVVRPDGRILAGGAVSLADGTPGLGAFQLTASGLPDPAFGSDGKAAVPAPGAVANDATVLADGSVVVVGKATGLPSLTGGFTLPNTDFAIAKITDKGQPDLTFGIGGVALVDFSDGADDEAFAVAPMPGNGFVVVGSTVPSTGDRDLAVAAFDGRGLPDPLFGGDGRFVKDFFITDNDAYAATVDDSGRVWVAGTTHHQGDFDFLTARLAVRTGVEADTDGDGLLDVWESKDGGVDVNFDGRPELNLWNLGARPDRKDLFVELDAMDKRAPNVLEVAAVRAAFAKAPVDNPDGSRGITLHMALDDDKLPWASWTPAVGFPDQFDVLKGQWFGTTADRAAPDKALRLAARSLVYRYGIVADSYDPGGSSGLARGIPSQDFIVTMAAWYDDSKRVRPASSLITGTIMHELGHTLGLYHNGGTSSPNFNTSYVSLMNYRHQFGRDLINPRDRSRDEVRMDGFPNYSASDVSYNDWANIQYTWRNGGPGGAGFGEVKPGEQHREPSLFADNPLYAERVVVAPGPGGPPVVRVLDAATGAELAPITAFDGEFTGGVRVARVDLTGDGVQDLIAGAGPGGLPLVHTFDGVTGERLREMVAFEPSFTGGVFVTAADFDGDGVADVVVSPDQGGGPRVRILSGADGATLADFFGIEDVDFRGGARVAVGDVNGDGAPDLVVAAGFGGGPRIAVFDGRTVLAPVPAGQLPPKLVADFYAFEDSLRNGTFVAAGDVTGDGAADLVFGAGPGGGPRVMVVSGADLQRGPAAAVAAPFANFFGGDPDNRSGIHVGVVDADADALADVVVGAAPGSPPRVTTYAGRAITGQPAPLRDELAFDPASLSGVFVG